MGKTIFYASSLGPFNLSAGATQYFQPGQVHARVNITTESQIQVSLFAAGVMSDMWVQIITNATTAASTVTNRKNSADANLTVSIGAGLTGGFSDTSHTDTIASGDDISTKFVAGSGGAIEFLGIRYVFTGSGATVAFPVATTSSATASATLYFGLSFATSNATTSEVAVQHKLKAAGTFSGLSVRIVSNGRSTDTTITSRKNGADGNLTVSIGSSLTGIFEDSTHSDSVAVDDLYNFSIVTDSGSGTITSRAVGVVFTSTGNGFPLIYSANAPLIPLSSTYYGQVTDLGLNSTDNAKLETGFAATLSKFACYVNRNTLTASSTLRLLKGGSTVNQVISIGSGITGYLEDASNTDVITSSDQMSWRIVTGGSGVEIRISVISHLAEQNGTSYSSSLGEAVVIVDQAIRTPSRSLSEAVAIVATMVKTPLRVFSETVTMVETFATVLGKSFQEVIAVVDTFSRVILRSLSEVITLVESYFNTAQKALAEALTIVDTIIPARHLILDEVVEVVDTVAKTLSKTFDEAMAIVDTFARTIEKALGEVVAITDVFIRAISRSLTEAVAVVDTFAFAKPLRGLIRGIAKRTNTIIGSISNKLVQRGKSTSTNTKRGTHL